MTALHAKWRKRRGGLGRAPNRNQNDRASGYYGIPSAVPHLRLHSPASIAGLGSEFEIPSQDVTVGRSAENQLVIPESSVSPRHARIQQTPQGWVLTDLENTNGIWVGVRRVNELQLTPGQLFRIGGVALEFVDDGQVPGIINERNDPDRRTLRSATIEGSGIRETDPSLHSNPAQVEPPDWEAPFSPEELYPLSDTPSWAPDSQSKGGRAGRIVAVLLGLTVLGFAVTMGAVFALRWLTKVRHSIRPVPSQPAATATANKRAESPSQWLAVTLADAAVDSLGAEQRVDVPNLLNLQLPANALHKATHVVIARAPSSGAEFCGATVNPTTVLEIATAYNSHWSQPATLEMVVDADQLARTRVPAMAIGFRDSMDQAWQLLPTEYDAARKVARAHLWQPGFVALYFFKGAEVYSASDHFAILLEPKTYDAQSAAPIADEQPLNALAQLESALSEYQKMGFRIAEGLHFTCASQANPPHSAALMPVFARRELPRPRSHALARAAFATIAAAYVSPGSMRGREFWFASMFDALATRISGVHVTSASPSYKRLASPLIADDWPSPPLYLSLLTKAGDPQPDLFRIWNDTTHVMTELDAKAGNEGQSPVLAVDLALQEMTKQSLLEHYAGYVNERLLAEHGLTLEALRSHDVCTQIAQLAEASRAGNATLEIPSSFTARWACLVIDARPDSVRSVQLKLAADTPASVSLRLLRLGSGQAVEPGLSAAHPLRVEVKSNEVFLLSAVNANMSQSASVRVVFDDVSLSASMVPSEATVVRLGQDVLSTLSLTSISEDRKTLVVQWEFGDGSPNAGSEWTANANGTLRVAQPHAWSKEGSYVVRATVFDAAQPTQALAAATRNVTVQSLKMEIRASSANPQPLADVTLHAKVSGPLPESPVYRFTFGDGSSPTSSSSPEVTHKYASVGDYNVTVELGAAPELTEALATAKLALSIRAADGASTSPSSTPQPAATDTPIP